MAYVTPEYAPSETELAVEIRGQLVAAKVVPLPFYKRPKKTAQLPIEMPVQELGHGPISLL